MPDWCYVTVSYDPTGYRQNYKRDIGAHDHDLADQFVQDAKGDSLARINAHLPAGQAAATLNDLGTTNLHVYRDNDPGPTYRLI